MNEITKNKLKMLEAKHHGDIQKAASRGTLRVYYGFSKVNRVQKHEAIAIVFENEQSAVARQAEAEDNCGKSWILSPAGFSPLKRHLTLP